MTQSQISVVACVVNC